MSPERGQGSTVDVDWIAAHLGEPGVRLVEIDVSRAAYDEGHIPGAVLWNAYADLRDPNYKPVGLAELARLLARSGITPETSVVTYGYSAPLGFWLLRAHGHEDVRMLMGSRDQWTQMGHEWSTDTPTVADSAHPPVVANDDLLASREYSEPEGRRTRGAPAGQIRRQLEPHHRAARPASRLGVPLPLWSAPRSTHWRNPPDRRRL